MQQLPSKKQIEHFRRCVVAAFNETSQDLTPFLSSAAGLSHSPMPPSFSSVGEWLQHLDLQQYQRLFLSAGLTMRDVHALTETQLVALGVPTVGARRRMLNSVDALKRLLPQAKEEPLVQAKKRNKNSAQKPGRSTPAASLGLQHADELPQAKTVTRITEKAAEQTAAAMLAALPPTAPAPRVTFLADSNIARVVPLFPGSVMRRVIPRACSCCPRSLPRRPNHPCFGAQPQLQSQTSCRKPNYR
jgi:hypothetical protein